MKVFTSGWEHRGFSPSRFDAECDFHTDGRKVLIVANGDSHLKRATPQPIVDDEITQDALSDATLDGEIALTDFLAHLQPWIYGGPLPSDRIVLIGGAPFDARQVFDFCMAMINAEVIGWRVVKGESPAYLLFMAGPDWVGAVASMDGGTGPQVLP